jgi:putative ATP-dependent endonuclease of the OLD family
VKVRHIDIKNFRGIKSLSWHVEGAFACLIGPGDTCKTTILTALDYALSPRTSLSFDDSDFFNQQTDEQIVIQVTLAEWDETQPAIKSLFQERKFAQYKCGLGANGPVAEPADDAPLALSVSFRVDKSLEPKWSIVKGRDESEDQDRKSIYATDRATLGLSRLDLFSDYHFTWGRNTILTRLSAEAEGNLNAVLSELAREMRQTDISDQASIAECQTIADTVRTEARDTGVVLTSLSPRVDIQRQSGGAGALSLHEDNVPLRNKGSGSKRLIGVAMQMKLHGGKNVSLIDEIEMGLEPHRIRGLIYKLRNSPQQIFATTHSPVVIRELDVAANELYVCKRDPAGVVTVQSLGTVSDIQSAVRANAEAFLGRKIIACEGLTEIGCLRAYDLHRFDESDAPIWSLATSYFNCGGASKIAPVCPRLIQLGYDTGALCDNDAPDQLTEADVQNLRAAGAHVCQWERGNSTEEQLLSELPWAQVPPLLRLIGDQHDTIEYASILDAIRNDEQLAGLALGADPASWSESPLIRHVVGKRAKDGNWIKRIDYAQKVFAFAFPHLPAGGVMMSRLDALWRWIQDE